MFLVAFIVRKSDIAEYYKIRGLVHLGHCYPMHRPFFVTKMRVPTGISKIPLLTGTSVYHKNILFI